MTLEDWVEMTDELGATPVVKTPDVAVADIVVASNSSAKVAKETVSFIEYLIVTVAEG